MDNDFLRAYLDRQSIRAASEKLGELLTLNGDIF